MCSVIQKNEIFFHMFCNKIKDVDRDSSTEVYRISCDDCSQCYIGDTKRALTSRLRKHQANCRNQNQHLAVVDHSEIGHSWGFDRARIVNTLRNTIKRKIAESLFIKNYSTVDDNKSLYFLSNCLSIFKL